MRKKSKKECNFSIAISKGDCYSNCIIEGIFNKLETTIGMSKFDRGMRTVGPHLSIDIGESHSHLLSGQGEYNELTNFHNIPSRQGIGKLNHTPEKVEPSPSKDSIEHSAELFRNATLQGRLKLLETAIFKNSKILCLELYEYRTGFKIEPTEDLSDGALSHTAYFNSKNEDVKEVNEEIPEEVKHIFLA